MSVIAPEEVSRLQSYLKRKLGNEGFALKMRERARDSVEVILNGEFLGVIYKDEEDGGVSYDLNIAILSEDLGE